MAVSNINDKNFIFAPITLNRDVNRGQGTSNIENLERRITRIDREIEATQNLVRSNNRIISIRENIIKLHQEQKQIILDQKENNNKIIANNNKAISQLQGLLDGKKPVRSKSVQPTQPSKLEEVNTLPKGVLISEQKAKLESDVKKHNIAIDYHNNKLDKLAADKAKDVAATTKPSKREGLATGYKPTSTIPTTLKADNKPDIVKSSSSYISNFSSQQQKYIAQSQANIWDSIVSANIGKLI